MREKYGKPARNGYGKQYRLSGRQAETVTRLLYDRVVKLQDDETVADRKRALKLRTEQRFVRKLIAVFETLKREELSK